MSQEIKPLEQSVTAQQQPRKKLKDMSSEERREYDRTAKQRSREKKKAVSIPAYEDFELPEAQRHALDEHSQPGLVQIAAELPYPLELEDKRIITEMILSLESNKRGWIKQVYRPSGMLYGGIFIDASVSDAIHWVHRFPALLGSATLSGLYREFLNLAKKLANQPWFDRQFARELESELAGKFKLPEPKVPVKTAMPAPPEPPIPSFTRIVEQSQLRMMDRLRDQLSPEAQQYLQGT